MGSNIKASLAVILSLCVVLIAWAPEPARGAAAETSYELIADGVTFGNDLILTGLNESLFHRQALAAADSESLAVSFPGALPFSPSTGTNLALPSIHETVDESIGVSSTGFFFANLPYYPCCNFGAAPVGFGQFGKPSPVNPAGFRGHALMYPEMVNKGILNPNLTYENKNLNNTMVTLPPLLSSGPYGEMAAIASVTKGETWANASSGRPGETADDTSFTKGETADSANIEKGGIADNATEDEKADNGSGPVNITPPLMLSTHRFNFDSNESAINNFSVVERMWRNSHLSHLMDIAYEGDASRPAWMAPLKPKDTLQLTDHAKVLRHGLNMTRPGKYLTKAFWDLNPLTPGRL